MFAIVWLCESSATVHVRVALPKLVNVALPETSPFNVSVGSEVALVLIVIFDPPLNDAEPDTAPLIEIVLAVCKVLAVEALPDVFWLPAVLTPGKFIFALPSNDTPPIVLAVCNLVAVAAFPVILDVIELGNLASDIVPDEILEAFKLVRPDPFPECDPENVPADNVCVDGLYVKCESSVSI